METVSFFFNTLVSTVFSAILFPLTLRLLLQFGNVDLSNPILAPIIQFTEKVIGFVKPYIPEASHPQLPAVATWLIIDIAKFMFCLFWLTYPPLSLLQYLLLLPCDFVMQTSTIIFYAVIFYYLLAFVAPGLEHPGINALKSISEPPCQLGRKIIPAATGFDFSPVLVLLITKLIQLLIVRHIPSAFFL